MPRSTAGLLRPSRAQKRGAAPGGSRR